MTATIPQGRPRRNQRGDGPALGKRRRWFGVAFGVLLGVAAVCHGCHLGDHDDELSLTGKTAPAQQKPDDDGLKAGSRK
ncbi:MAG TPA: hypothetical protein VMS17_20715 [Gemmataceae bacterium]|nr:hypothetical protein [Gemmataceae bacterium]